MRSLRPLFGRYSIARGMDAQAERLKNRDWVEVLRVVHPNQAESAEREYLLARLREDWPRLTTALLATHTMPIDFKMGKLTVACDHNTFANELTLLAPNIEKIIAERYSTVLKIRAQTRAVIDWKVDPPPENAEHKTTAAAAPRNAALEKLLRELDAL